VADAAVARVRDTRLGKPGDAVRVEPAARELVDARDARAVSAAMVLALIATLIWGVLIPVQIVAALG
jgi:hypothetical protein